MAGSDYLTDTQEPPSSSLAFQECHPLCPSSVPHFTCLHTPTYLPGVGLVVKQLAYLYIPSCSANSFRIQSPLL